MILPTLKSAYFKLLYGKSLQINPLKLGPGLDINIRNKGTILLSAISSRKNLSIFADGGSITIAKGCFFNNGCSINSMSNISIGENSIFGEGVKIYDHNHEIAEDFTTQLHDFSTAKVSIGKNCWLGSNVVILKGVSIGDNIIIGAGAIVRKSITEAGIYASSSDAIKKIK